MDAIKQVQKILDDAHASASSLMEGIITRTGGRYEL